LSFAAFNPQSAGAFDAALPAEAAPFADAMRAGATSPWGSFEGFRGYNDRGWGLADVLADRLGSLGVPVLGGLYAGHDLIGPDGAPDQMALPLGSVATLDTHSGTLTVGPVVR
jgi:hypothetical protein